MNLRPKEEVDSVGLESGPKRFGNGFHTLYSVKVGKCPSFLEDSVKTREWLKPK